MRKSFSRKIASTSLAVAMMITSALPVFGATTNISAVNTVNTFGDISGHWGQQAIEKWNQYGIVQGFDGKFRPNAPVTRAEFSVMIDKVMKYIETGNNVFSDLSPEQWYYGAMIKLNTAGILKGVSGNAMPNETITRQEAAVLLTKAFKTSDSNNPAIFSDSDQIADWAKGAVQSLVSSSVIGGRPDGTFGPQESLTRAEAVTLFDQLIQTLITKKGAYSQDVQGNVVVNSPDVTLKDMTISGDLYVAQGVGEGEVTLNDVKIKGNVYVQGGGENSIIFNNVDVQGALVVNKYNGQVRILATGSTSVSLTVLESGALVVTKDLTGGGFETIEIPADVLAGQEIKLDGNFNKVINYAEGVQITAEGSIKELIAEADTSITGKVTLDKASGNSNVLVNGAKPSTSGGTGTPNTGSGSSSGGNAGGGSGTGGSAPGNGNNNIAVTGVSISPSSLALLTGETKQLTAVVTPIHATNQKVNWKVADNSVDVLSVTSTGLVTAKGPGQGTVIVTTEDGAFSSSAAITVTKPSLHLELTKFDRHITNPETPVEEETLTNSENVTISNNGKSMIQKNHYDAAITASQPLQGTVTSSVYTIVSLTYADDTPLSDLSGVKVTLDGNDYIPEYGAGLNQDLARFILKLNIRQPERIETHRLVVSREGFADTSMTITYRPTGTVVLTKIEDITGDLIVGSELTAGPVQYDGNPANLQITYQWYRSDTETGLYSIINGATSSKYTLTEADAGKYIRVYASADEIQVSGSALSSAFGPVQTPVSADEIFSKIEEVFLGANTNQNNIVGNLTLPASLPAYPGVVITWSTSDEAVITNNGVVTRIEGQDQFAKLTAVLSGAAAGARDYDFTVRAVGTDHVEIDGYIDPYFVNGYPQAYIKDGTIHVKYALNAPAEVYMVVNVINGHIKSDVKSVLEGHSGENNDIVFVDAWPYFNLNADQVNKIQDFDTGVKITRANNLEAKVEFVIVDTPNNYTSSAVTRIQFEKSVVGSLDTQPPNSYAKFINDALDHIYIYYDEKLDLSSVPSVQDFNLSVGQVQSVSIHNSDKQYGMAPSHVKLVVSGISSSDLNSLKISYTGTALQDISDARNKAESYSNAEILSNSPNFKNITLSSDRRTALIEVEPGWDPDVNRKLVNNDFTMQIANSNYQPSSIDYSYSMNLISYTLKFDSPLPEGETRLKFNSNGLVDRANDLYPAEMLSEPIMQLPPSGTPTASYDQSRGEILLSFDNGFQLDSSATIAAGLTLKVDGVEYNLRGYLLSVNWNSKNQIYIRLTDKYSWRFKEALEQGSDVQMKYSKVNQHSQQQLSDIAGALVPDFDYIQVNK
ncbi:S-layer homology domain-containing protein [Paenibacillus fonticola]|uniref:S-layer homology domain-containing protein n=1 Tax=Paenibacillus fonticola TaxID=379896 RepID=UPI0003621990|nr:S-layer homology domain-containing protein [Paenibacillus fonticola]